MAYAYKLRDEPTGPAAEAWDWIPPTAERRLPPPQIRGDFVCCARCPEARCDVNCPWERQERQKHALKERRRLENDN